MEGVLSMYGEYFKSWEEEFDVKDIYIFFNIFIGV